MHYLKLNIFSIRRALHAESTPFPSIGNSQFFHFASQCARVYSQDGQPCRALAVVHVEFLLIHPLS